MLTLELSRPSLGYVQMTTLTASVALSSIPTGATFAVIQAESQNVRYRDDSVAPEAGVGMQLQSGVSMTYSGDLSKLRFIEETAGAKLNILYYR